MLSYLRRRLGLRVQGLILLLCLVAAGVAATPRAEARLSSQSAIKEALDADTNCRARQGSDAAPPATAPFQQDDRCMSLLQADKQPYARVMQAAPPRVPDVDVGPGARLSASEARAEKLKVAIPVGAIILGVLSVFAGHKTIGLLAVYFGSQSGLSLFMKLMLSGTAISKELELYGVPAPFLVTGVQQVVVFCVIIPFTLLAGIFSPMSELSARKLTSRKEWLGILCFSAAFAGNFGLNNLSLSLIAVSMNLIIRSCLPIVTLLTQVLMGFFMPTEVAMEVKRSEVFLMLSGVICAGMATMASGAGVDGVDTATFIFGVVVCLASVFAAALNLVIARLLGAGLDMNPVEATLYTSLPSGFFLFVPALLVPHPTAWPHYSMVTDWQVFLKILELSPTTLGLVGLSGIFAAAYNILQYVLVQYLSATHTAFAGNFNKAATIFLSIALGLEELPAHPWNYVMIAAVLGNILSFTGFSMLKATEKKAKSGQAKSDCSSDRGPQSQR